MYEIERREYKPNNFFAGDFPTLPESGVAGAAVKEYTPVAAGEGGKIFPVAADTLANVVGITAAAADKDDPVVYYMTGEFFAEALNVPAGVELAAVKDALRKVSIFLR